MKKIEFSKRNGLWFGSYSEKIITHKSSINPLHDEFYWRIIETVESDSYQGLLIEFGEKKWIDDINKNQ